MRNIFLSQSILEEQIKSQNFHFYQVNLKNGKNYCVCNTFKVTVLYADNKYKNLCDISKVVKK